MNKNLPLPNQPLRITDQSFELIYNAHWEKLYAICHHKVKDSELAKELVQEVFFSIWERKDSLVIEGTVENYLVKAVKLKTLEHFRLLIIHRKHLENIGIHQKLSENTTENHVVINELSLQLQQFVRAMPGQCRKVFELSRTEGLNNKEIAVEMLLSEKTVKNHLTRALHYLRNKLNDKSVYEISPSIFFLMMFRILNF